MTDAPDGRPPRKGKRGRSRADFEATVADIEAQVRATNAKFEAQVRATNAKIEARTGRNLPLAILIGLGLGFALLFSLILVKDFFLVFAAVLLVFTSLELSTAVGAAGRSVPRIPTVIAAMAVGPAAFYWHSTGQWFAFFGGLVLVTVWRLAEALRKRDRSCRADLLRDIFTGIFVQSYIVFLGSFSVLLAGQPQGQWWTLGFLIVVISTDTGAYVTGLTLGKHPMAPNISPKKTWEGFAGSVTLAIIAGIVVSIFMLHVNVLIGVLFGVAIALAATLGDLTESLIKRDIGIKDISTWLPGHGGFLDRLDSVFPAAPVAFALYLLFA